jgi:hypothetical protein
MQPLPHYHKKADAPSSHYRKERKFDDDERSADED